MTRCGVSQDWLVNREGESAHELLVVIVFAEEQTPDRLAWASDFQDHQDSDSSWGSALEKADFRWGINE